MKEVNCFIPTLTMCTVYCLVYNIIYTYIYREIEWLAVIYTFNSHCFVVHLRYINMHTF